VFSQSTLATCKYTYCIVLYFILQTTSFKTFWVTSIYHITVLSLRDPLQGMLHRDFLRLTSKYKFTLAMENAICDDYITEKIWRPLEAGSVPIIFGSPKIKVILFCSYRRNRYRLAIVFLQATVVKNYFFVIYLTSLCACFYKKNGFTKKRIIAWINICELLMMNDLNWETEGCVKNVKCLLCKMKEVTDQWNGKMRRFQQIYTEGLRRKWPFWAFRLDRNYFLIKLYCIVYEQYNRLNYFELYSNKAYYILYKFMTF